MVCKGERATRRPAPTERECSQTLLSLIFSKILFSHILLLVAFNEMTLPKSLFLVDFEVNRVVLSISFALALFSMYVI